MKKTLTLLFILFTFNQLMAQTIKERSIDVSIGYGLSEPYDEVDISGSGFFLQGEYVLTLASWIDVRPYVGFIVAKTNTDNIEPEYKSNANAVLLGAKTRITAPIPWVAPYVELGIGASIGSFTTFTPFTNIDKSGLILHIPFSVGLKLGPKQNFDMAFTYYFHNSVEQYVGAAAIGISFPLEKK